MNYQFPHSRGTPPGRPDVHRVGGSRSVRRQRLFAGVLAVWFVVAVIIYVMFAGPMSGRIGFLLGRDLGGEVAPASGRIAFYSDRDGDDEIYVMNADGSDLVQLTENDSDDHDPAWSPDGGRIAFTSERDNDSEIYDIYVMNADGSGVEQLTDGCSNRSPAWSPDGGRFAFVSRGDIYVMDADGSGMEQLTGNPSESCASVFFSDRDGDGYNELYVMNTDGTVELFTDYDSLDWDSANWHPSWSPDSDHIVFQSRRDGDWEVYVMNADGRGVERLTDNEKIDWWPVWSPDGGRILFTSNRDGHDGEIYVMKADGAGVKRLTDNEYNDSGPVWSPDGGRIAFSSYRDDYGGLGTDGYEIYVMNVDGSGVVRLTANEHSDAGPAWSPLFD